MSMQPLLDAVEAALQEAGLFHSGARLLCAVSGGADSVALLHALCRLRPAAGYVLEAVHVQHGLRGESSLADERFVRDLCARLDVPLHVEQAGLAGGMDDPGAETRARESRRRIFAAGMDALGMDALITAHHRGDQAETVLMHLLRGAGAEGLRGMQPSAPFGRGVALRPFLGLSKQALLDALAGEGLTHREDESNQSALTPRNALRLNVLPALEALFPGAEGHIAQAAEALRVDERLLAAQAEALQSAALLRLSPVYALNRQMLLAAPEALARRALRMWYATGAELCGGRMEERALSHEGTRALYALLSAPAGTALNLPYGLKAVTGAAHVHLCRQGGGALEPMAAPEPVAVAPGRAQYALPGLVLAAQPAQAGGPLPGGPSCVALSREVLARVPVLRAPRPGDRIRPFGAPGAKPLRRCLSDRKIDPFLRPLCFVLAVGSEVLWIPGLVSAEGLRLAYVPEGSLRLCVVQSVL